MAHSFEMLLLLLLLLLTFIKLPSEIVFFEACYIYPSLN